MVYWIMCSSLFYKFYLSCDWGKLYFLSFLSTLICVFVALTWIYIFWCILVVRISSVSFPLIKLYVLFHIMSISLLLMKICMFFSYLLKRIGVKVYLSPFIYIIYLFLTHELLWSFPLLSLLYSCGVFILLYLIYLSFTILLKTNISLSLFHQFYLTYPCSIVIETFSIFVALMVFYGTFIFYLTCTYCVLWSFWFSVFVALIGYSGYVFLSLFWASPELFQGQGTTCDGG